VKELAANPLGRRAYNGEMPCKRGMCDCHGSIPGATTEREREIEREIER